MNNKWLQCVKLRNAEYIKKFDECLLRVTSAIEKDRDEELKACSEQLSEMTGGSGLCLEFDGQDAKVRNRKELANHVKEAKDVLRETRREFFRLRRIVEENGGRECDTVKSKWALRLWSGC